MSLALLNQFDPFIQRTLKQLLLVGLDDRFITTLLNAISKLDKTIKGNLYLSRSGSNTLQQQLRGVVLQQYSGEFDERWSISHYDYKRQRQNDVAILGRCLPEILHEADVLFFNVSPIIAYPNSKILWKPFSYM